jgi:hypothetical protein
LKAEAWQRVKRLIDQKRISVCAWCRRPYTDKGVVGVKLTDAQYAEVVSHGICQQCKAEMLDEGKAKKTKAAE